MIDVVATPEYWLKVMREENVRLVFSGRHTSEAVVEIWLNTDGRSIMYKNGEHHGFGLRLGEGCWRYNAVLSNRKISSLIRKEPNESTD